MLVQRREHLRHGGRDALVLFAETRSARFSGKVNPAASPVPEEEGASEDFANNRMPGREFFQAYGRSIRDPAQEAVLGEERSRHPRSAAPILDAPLDVFREN